MTLDSEQIRQVLPHRYPFLLVDRILEMEAGVRAVGLKNVTANEPFFQGHWPHRAVMPAVLIVEAMAQVCGVMLLAMPEHKGKNAYFTGIDKARFRRPVVPGDSLIITANVGRVRGTIGFVNVKAEVDGQVACQGDLMFALAQDTAENAAAAIYAGGGR